MSKALEDNCSSVMCNSERLKILAAKCVNNVKYTMSQSNIASLINYGRNLNSEKEIDKIIKKYDNDENDKEFDLDAWIKF